MRSFKVELKANSLERAAIEIGFVGEAHNDLRIVDAVDAIKQLNLAGGKLVTFDGPCSLPVAMALAHAVAHLYGAVAVKDPKLGKFVVAISHRPDMKVGMLID